MDVVALKDLARGLPVVDADVLTGQGELPVLGQLLLVQSLKDVHFSMDCRSKNDCTCRLGIMKVCPKLTGSPPRMVMVLLDSEMILESYRGQFSFSTLS